MKQYDMEIKPLKTRNKCFHRFPQVKTKKKFLYTEFQHAFSSAICFDEKFIAGIA